MLATLAGLGATWLVERANVAGWVDAGWWNVLPWVLLAAFWIGFIVWGLRRRSRAGREAGDR